MLATHVNADFQYEDSHLHSADDLIAHLDALEDNCEYHKAKYDKYVALKKEFKRITGAKKRRKKQQQ